MKERTLTAEVMNTAMPASATDAARSMTGRGPGWAASVDARMLALMRCTLAFSALIIIWIIPTEPARLVEWTYLSLSGYCVYSAVLAFMSFRAGWPTPRRGLHWVDVLFYSCLIALTEGTSSIFFYFYIFSIMVASFTRGYREGLLVTFVSAASFLTGGVLSAPSGTEFELARTLIRPVYLFALGYMIAYWGGYEILLKRRLNLLQEVSSSWNPRSGVDRTISNNLDRLLNFHSANLALLVMKRPDLYATYLMFTASPGKSAWDPAPSEITGETAEPLLRLPETLAATYCDFPRWWWPGKRRRYALYGLDAGAPAASAIEACDALANLLDASSFVTVPYRQRDGMRGRICLTSRTQVFTQSDVEFIFQVSATVSPVVESMLLMEEFISKASAHERHNISRDIHDSTIQPYIGLKLGLDALYREAGAQGPLSRKIGELVEMADMTIRDLRAYAATLKDKKSFPGEALRAAVLEQAERYRRFYGIDVEVKTELSDRLTGRLAAEIFQMIVEGLSNVLKHTSAKRAYVSLVCEPDELLLKIGNEAPGSDGGAVDFVPRSIHERAQALGGRVFVEQSADGDTVVQVTIPS